MVYRDVKALRPRRCHLYGWPMQPVLKADPKKETGQGDPAAAEMLRTLWLAIGRDEAVQRRVMELLEEVRRECDGRSGT